MFKASEKIKTAKPKVMLYLADRSHIEDGWYCSEKLDGVRGRWDGETMVTRNGLVVAIPDSIRKDLSGTDLVVEGEFFKGRDDFHDVVKAVQSPKKSQLWLDSHDSTL